jgi:hypothetical protein
VSDPVRDLWSRLRSLGRKMEDEVYDFTEEDAERKQEARGRNTLIALTNSFFTIWRANEASIGERTLGVLGFGSIFWLVVVDRGLAFKKTPLRLLAVYAMAGLIGFRGLFSELAHQELRPLPRREKEQGTGN